MASNPRPIDINNSNLGQERSSAGQSTKQGYSAVPDHSVLPDHSVMPELGDVN